MARVLIVEDEVLLRSAMARGIAKMPGITVAQAGTLADALESVDKQPPEMIVSDIDLPDRSGVELLGELGRRRLRIPILFVSAYVKAYGAQIPRHADVDVREKPLRLDELRTIIENRLAGQGPGEEAPFAPADYLQLACLGHRSVVIDVEGAERKGHIIVHDGMLWTAIDGSGEGIDAFRRLAFIPRAVVRVRALRDEPGTRTIHGHWEQVLLDAACEHDEATRGASAPPASDRVTIELPLAAAPQSRRSGGEPPLSRTAPKPPPPRPPAPTLPSADVAPRAISGTVARDPDGEMDNGWGEDARDAGEVAFDTAFEAGIEALLVKNYGEAYAAFERAAAIRPNDAKVLTNLERLRQLGHGPQAS